MTGIPTTIRGVTYPSRRAAAAALGLAHSSMDKAVAEGRLDRVGLGMAGRILMPVTMRGVTYANAEEAAKAAGVKRATIYMGIHRGNLDHVGIRPPYNHAVSKPFVLGGMTWPSLRAASLELGFKPAFVSQTIRRKRQRGMERILAAAMRLRVELDSMAVAA